MAPYLALFAPMLFISGCTALDANQQDTLDRLETQVSSVQEQVVATNQSMEALQQVREGEANDLQTQLDAIDQRLAKLPKTIKQICPKATSTDANCPESGTPVIVRNDGKMIVGELERVWIDPPGVEIIARIDTGASSSSVHAANLEEFERDGDKWVRFEWQLKDQTVTTERPVVRYVRVIQQADPKGTRRPVVNMFLQIGNVENNFDFTLADRAHLNYQIILGRNFLTDVALVDVGQQFVQPTRKRKVEEQAKSKS